MSRERRPGKRRPRERERGEQVGDVGDHALVPDRGLHGCYAVDNGSRREEHHRPVIRDRGDGISRVTEGEGDRTPEVDLPSNGDVRDSHVVAHRCELTRGVCVGPDELRAVLYPKDGAQRRMRRGQR